jgi:hypothetical protein
MTVPVLVLVVLVFLACAVAAVALDVALTWLEGRGGTWAQTVAEAKRQDQAWTTEQTRHADVINSWRQQ